MTDDNTTIRLVRAERQLAESIGPIDARRGRVLFGEARITPAFRLPAKHVIYTVGPRWRGGTRNEPESLASCYRASLRLAVEHGLRSVAFPAISTGAFAYPLLPACRIAVSECATFLRSAPSAVDVMLVAYSKEDAAALGRALAEMRVDPSRP